MDKVYVLTGSVSWLGNTSINKNTPTNANKIAEIHCCSTNELQNSNVLYNNITIGTIKNNTIATKLTSLIYS